jgi:hypothetical protein
MTDTPLNFKDLEVGEVYLSEYVRSEKLLPGRFEFTVKELFVNKARIVFIFPIRRGTIKGDEPAIFEQNTETKA